MISRTTHRRLLPHTRSFNAAIGVRAKNISSAAKIVMVIHGRLDEEVDGSHGVAMHQAVPNHLKRDPCWVPDRGHNDITEGPGKLAEFIGRLRAFLVTLD